MDKKLENSRLESLKALDNKKLEKDEKVSKVSESISESIDLDIESSESMGNVSEQSQSKASENKSGGSSATGDDGDAIRKHLLENLPSKNEMRRQIENEIRKEIRTLHKEAMRLVKDKNTNYFEFTNVVKKLRTLKSTLNGLVRVSLDGLKNLWLKFVHGIK